MVTANIYLFTCFTY